MLQADKKATGRRLEAVQKALGCATVDDFADRLGLSRSRLNNWLNGYHAIPVDIAARVLNLPEMRGLTADWLYYGVPDAMPVKLFIQLKALEEGLDPPMGDGAEEADRRPSASAERLSVSVSRRKATSP